MTLLAVLASPPLTTTGDRTRRRVGLAAELLGFDSVRIVNLFNSATANVGEINHTGAAPDVWWHARPIIETAMGGATAVLLGWGHAEPTGSARHHHRQQVEWLQEQIARRGLQSWTVGGTPRHPSRWQRYTSRMSPHLAFPEALRQALVLVSSTHIAAMEPRSSP